MSQPSSRELLFGMLAVSQQFLKPEELIEATTVWARDGQRQSLADSLVARGAITEAEHSIVDSILREKSEDDVRDSLRSALGADLFRAVRHALERIDDAGADDTLQQSAATEVPSTATPAGDDQRFEITQELARGGLGEVFIARDRQLNRNVALKQILQRWLNSPDFNERFLMEAEITGRLEHPGVVPVYALGRRSDGCYYYAMRLIRGVTLEAEIERFFDPSARRDSTERNLELHQLLRRFIDVCHTIDYAHSRGVIHRDLKPANIMLGKYGETLVVDWGLAKHVDVGEDPATAAESLLVPGSGSGSAATQYGSALGTPRYMSPEQAAGHLHLIGPASDIYSLGATFYHLLTGKPPQTGISIEQLLEKVRRNEFPPPRSVRGDVARPLEAICLRAMRLSPSDRYDSAGEMAQDIERWLADQRVQAYDEPPLATAARCVRRHQAAAATAAVSIILLCIAATVGTLLWQQMQARQREQAQQLRREQFEREQEDRRQLDRRRTGALANLRFGQAEAQAGRFQSALGFFQQGEQACADEPRLDDERLQLSRHARQMAQLVEFERLSDEAVVAVLFEQDQRARVLMTAALRQLGVFDHADWWNHLPAENLHPRDADRIEKRVHLQLVLLCSVLAKTSLTPQLLSRRAIGLPPPKLDDEQRRMQAAIRLTGEMAQAYRTTEWVTRVEESDRYFMGVTSEIPPPPQWQADNFVDAFMLGCMCIVVSYSGESGFASAFATRFLGVEDTRQAGAAYLHRARDLEPDNYLVHFMLGWIEQQQGNFDAARSSFSHAIGLRPDLVLGYDMRSYTSYNEAMSHEDDDRGERRRLLTLALQDADTARNLAPQFEIIYWLRGNALRQLGQSPLAASAYLAALEREPPLDALRLKKWVILLQGRDPNRVRRLSFLMSDRFEEAQKYARQLRQSNPRNPLYPLLEAAASLELKQLDEAESAAGRVLALETENSPLSASVAARARAIQGEIHRQRGQWGRARDAFSEALRLDANNTLAAAGMAATLEELAEDADDPAPIGPALTAYDKLAEVALTDWQSMRAAEGRFRLLLKQGETVPANAELDRMRQLEWGLDLVALRKIAETYRATETLAKLDALHAQTQIPERLAGRRLPRTLPLRNGDFQLGLNSYWTPWSTRACIADAAIDRQSRPGGGDACLRIEHQSAPYPESRGVLQQTIPAAAGSRYRVSLWAKGRQVTRGGFRIVVDEQWEQPVAVLPQGDYDWRPIGGEFEVPAATDDAAPRLIRFKIVSTAPGNAWLDDIRIERIVE